MGLQKNRIKLYFAAGLTAACLGVTFRIFALRLVMPAWFIPDKDVNPHPLISAIIIVFIAIVSAIFGCFFWRKKFDRISSLKQGIYTAIFIWLTSYFVFFVLSSTLSPIFEFGFAQSIKSETISKTSLIFQMLNSGILYTWNGIIFSGLPSLIVATTVIVVLSRKNLLPSAGLN